MTIQERAEIVKANLALVEVGDTFPTASTLINALGLPKETSNKENTKAVLAFLTWESTGRLNKSGKVSKEIRITSIVKNPDKVEIEDLRANNKGGNNEKYASFIRDALMNYPFDPEYPMTNKQIINIVLGYNFTEISKKYKSKWKDMYFDRMYQALNDSLRTSLKALQRDGKIIHRFSYFIKPLHSSGYDCFSFPEIGVDTTMYDFLYSAYYWAIDGYGEADIMTRFTSAFNCYADKIYSLKRLTVYQLLSELAESDKFNKSYQAMLQVRDKLLENEWPFVEPEEYDLQEVSNANARFFDSIDDISHSIYGFSQAETALNQKKQKKVNDLSSHIYEFLSYDYVYKAHYIEIIAKPEVIKTHKKRSFAEIAKGINKPLEETMADFAANKTYDKHDRVVEGYHRYCIGMESVPIRYYMAFDKVTNDMHCDFFGIQDKEDYLIKHNKYVRNYLAKGHSIAELKRLPLKAKARYEANKRRS